MIFVIGSLVGLIGGPLMLILAAIQLLFLKKKKDAKLSFKRGLILLALWLGLLLLLAVLTQIEQATGFSFGISKMNFGY